MDKDKNNYLDWKCRCGKPAVLRKVNYLCNDCIDGEEKKLKIKKKRSLAG